MTIIVEKVGSRIIVKVCERAGLGSSSSTHILSLTTVEAHVLEDKLEDVLNHR